jgi:hypothetical protein
MSEKETKDYGLPKWPQMVVSGRPVTADQAMEIIRRTDSFLCNGYGGNDHDWNARMKHRLGMPDTDRMTAENSTPKQFHAAWGRLEAWQRAWGCIETEYVHNNWLSTAFIGGPHGWCRPDGRIEYSDNVGKWPSAESVESDWRTLATEFPFLHLAATLMSGESCEDHRRPVCTILVREGAVTLVDGDLRHHAEYGLPNTSGRDLMSMAMSLHLSPRLREHHPIPEDWYEKWEAIGRAVAAGLPSS